jgi:aspartyl-tRNA(Asn)/glutamyl-tRNA(Gln) amidotransferase subunit B
MPSPVAPAFEPVIGLEVHAELLTRSKMFCACPVVEPTLASPNSAVCEVCTGMPGTLPVINARAIEFALRAALALHCQIAHTSQFARKNYFYPDLPKGFQISQYELPLAVGGRLSFETPGGPKRVRIRRVHLEEDTGKLTHRAHASLVDFNRSGVPLLEIVSEPDLTSLDDVKPYTTALRSILRYLDVTSGDMEKGAIRFEANVSVRPAGGEGLGVRTEIKNLNSFRAMMRALEYEVKRHSRLLATGQPVLQETLRWDEVKGVTYAERNKEDADDYRYFPEPDLPPLVIDPAWVERLRADLPELPDARSERFTSEYRLRPYAAGVLTAERSIADFFEATVRAASAVAPDRLAHWLSGDLFALLNEAGLSIEDSRVSPQALAEIVSLVEAGRINQPTAKTVLAEVFASGRSPAQVVAAEDLGQLSDPQAISRLVDETLAAHPEQVEQYLAGKAPIAQWLFGQVMRAAGGRANPAVVRDCLGARLRGLEENRRAP